MSFSEWKEVTLSDISIGNKGSYGIAAAAVEYSKDLFTYLRITDISDDGVLNKDSLMSVDDMNAAKYLLEPNDIVFARTGNSTGRSYFYDGRDGKLVYAGFLIKFSLDSEKVNPKFMRYYTLSSFYRNWVASFSTGSTRGNINAQTYGNMKIDLPPREQQDFLVNILSALDDKIEVNNQINKTLESMAQEIFKHWFIDFEFPNENGEPYKSSGGEMVESELGMIPKGWTVTTLGDIVVFNYGKALTSKDRVEGDVKVYSSAGHTGFHNKALVEEDGIIVGRKGTIGTVYYAREKFYCIDTAYYITQKDCKFDLILVFQLLKQLKLKELNEDSAVPGLNRNTVYTQKIVLPTSEIAGRLNNILNSIILSMFHYNDEKEILTKLRDTLLPKLMSGEIRVPINN